MRSRALVIRSFLGEPLRLARIRSHINMNEPIRSLLVKWKPMRLTYGHCTNCDARISDVQLGWFSPEAHAIRCAACGVPRLLPEQPTEAESQLRQDNAIAGSAAFREWQKSRDPTWRRGAIGEYRTAQFLKKYLREDAMVLHDRALPDSPANVDHIVVAPSGVWIIDAKNWSGVLNYRPEGHGRFRERLFVDGVDKTYKVEAVYDAVLPIAQMLMGFEPPIHPAVVFVSPEYKFRMGLRLKIRGPIRHDGVLLGDAWGLTKRMNKPGLIDKDRIQSIHELLASKMPSR
jgi:Nuclease-related domain